MPYNPRFLRAVVLPATLALGSLFNGLALPALAQESPLNAPAVTANPADKKILQIELGYVRSSSGAVNSETQAGLSALAEEVKKRTAVDVQGVKALDPENDDLSLYQFIYWPVTPDAKTLSEKARSNVQHYINTGGVILFDLRDAGGVMRNQQSLQRLMAGISLKPLTALAKDHTLTKTFYQLAGLPGSSAFGTTWVEKNEGKGTESVSSVIIGDSNWAGAWAGRSVLSTSREREMALRSGINMVLYAYTGNFKSDPIQPVLERLTRP